MAAAMISDIFDRKRRRSAYFRTIAQPETPIFHGLIAEGLIDRLSMVTRQFERALIINPTDNSYKASLGSAAVDIVSLSGSFEEDRPSLPPGVYDLVLVPWGLETVNDLPGALSLIRMAMKPDALFLASFPGAGSFARLREAFRLADMEISGQMAARFHPQIEVRAMGDLLARAGFTLPVVDVDVMDIRYSDMRRAVADLREHGWGHMLTQRSEQLSRAALSSASRNFLIDGSAPEQLHIITVTAWTPGENQPKPAARGSGSQSLANVLRKPGK